MRFKIWWFLALVAVIAVGLEIWREVPIRRSLAEVIKQIGMDEEKLAFFDGAASECKARFGTPYPVGSRVYESHGPGPSSWEQEYQGNMTFVETFRFYLDENRAKRDRLERMLLFP